MLPNGRVVGSDVSPGCFSLEDIAAHFLSDPSSVKLDPGLRMNSANNNIKKGIKNLLNGVSRPTNVNIDSIR